MDAVGREKGLYFTVYCYKQLEMTLKKAYLYTSRMMSLNMMTQDAHEGISAFIEKRNPKWKNK